LEVTGPSTLIFKGDETVFSPRSVRLVRVQSGPLGEEKNWTKEGRGTGIGRSANRPLGGVRFDCKAASLIGDPGEREGEWGEADNGSSLSRI